MLHTFVLAAALATQTATVPFTVESNHVVIDIVVDGTPTRALFDTGGGNALDATFAKAHNLKLAGHGVAGGVGEGTVEAAETHVSTLAFGPFALRDQHFAVFPLPGALTRGQARPIDAIVGREILHRFAARLDYDAQTLTFTPLADFKYSGAGIAVPFVLRGGTPEVQGEIDGVSGLFQIDTGSSASLILTSPFVAANDLRQKYHTLGSAISGRGIGGYTRGDLARGKTLTLGSVAISDPLLDLSTDTRGVFASRRLAGNVGNDILRRFTITFDYEHHVMYFERNAETAIPSSPNRAGMYVQNDDPRYFDVVDVVPNGPAYESGLRVGDHITAIDGKPAKGFTGDQFWALMRGPPGETHIFTVERDGKLGAVMLTLRELV